MSFKEVLKLIDVLPKSKAFRNDGIPKAFNKLVKDPRVDSSYHVQTNISVRRGII